MTTLRSVVFGSFSLLATFLTAAAAAHAAPRPRFAVLPLRQLAECTPATSAAFTAKLEAALRAQGAAVVPRGAVLHAMAAAGVKPRGPASTEALVAIGKAVGAARGIAGGLRIPA